MHDSHDEAKREELFNRLIEYAKSSNFYNRNQVGATALETLPLVASSPKDVATVLELLSTVAVDPAIDVRCNILEYIVHIALMLSDPHKSCETLRSFITSHILPIIVTALQDIDYKVVELADCGLIALLEHCLVPNGYVQERIWPAIVKNMYDEPCTDPIVRVITLMRKMVPWVGCDTTETLFVPLFIQLCSYPDTIPRRACASIIGDLCAVVSLNTVENKLVPSFLTLCSDSMWIVKKACANVFTSVSSAATAHTRKHHLAPAFANLLTDPQPYVRSAAFHSLGPFITTFAEPSITNLCYNHQGKLVLRHPDGFEFQLAPSIELNLTEERAIVSEAVMNVCDFLYCDYDTFSEEKSAEEHEVYQAKQEAKLEDNMKFNLEAKSGNDQNSTVVSFSNSESEEISSEQDDDDDKADKVRKNMVRRNLSFNYDPNSATNSERENRIDVTRSDEVVFGERDWSPSGKERWNIVDNENEKKWIDEEDRSINNNERNICNPAENNSEQFENSAEKVNANSSVDVENEGSTLSTDLKENEDVPVDENSSYSYENSQTCDTVSKEHPDNSNEVNYETSKTQETDEKDFNGFVFWRDPIPDIDIDPKLVTEAPLVTTDNSSNLLQKNSTKHLSGPKILRRECKSSGSLIHSKDNIRYKISEPSWKEYDKSFASDNYCPTEKLEFTKQKNQLFLAFIQHIESSNFIGVNTGGDGSDDSGSSVVPDELINHFVSMSSPRQDKMQNELAHYCAYNLPAVALTLGPENWALIKKACNSLATDQQWKVRRIVASSIHELAVIVGTDVATEDLVPVFTGFIKDLDEVRIGALKHLANFLKLLKPAIRNTLLPRLAEFLKTDYEWNWRFRAELAEQLLQIVRLFSPEDISVHLAPVAFTLLQDKVAHVRNISVLLVVEMVSVISKEGVLVRSAVAELAEQFAHSSRWCRRQTFAHLCSSLVEHKALPLDMFARDILPHLLDLSWDKVPNVRLSVAKTLSQQIMTLDMFSNPSSPHNEVVVIVIKRLQGDKDRDVRYFATLHPHSTSEPEYISPQLPESSNVDSNKLNEAEDTPR